MRTIVKAEKLEWRELKSRLSQGSVLALMFLVNINDMTEEVSSYISLCI